MADDTTRIINLTEATEVSDGMYLVTDASTGTRKLSLQKVLDKVGGNVADEYDSTATYDVGDLCVYKGVLYECTTAISTAEAWNSAHWSRINLGDIVADIDGSIEELYEDKANESGEYDNIVAGTAKQLLSSIYTTNDSPYLYRPTPADSDRERVKRIEGLSVGWNQLCNASSVTVTSGHKYYMKKASVESIGASDGTALTGLTSGTDMVVDLTLLFGSATIADHIYTLEQATAGSGVAWVKQYIDLDTYHPYSAPTIKSVEGLESHVMTGFNQLNPVSFSIGANYNKNAGVTLQTDGTGATVSGENPIKVAVTTNWRGAVFFSNVLAKGVEYAVSYRITGSAPTNIKRTIWFVDKDNVIISKLSSSSSVEQDVNYVYTASYTPSEDGLRMALTFESATQQTVEVYDLCVHVRGDGTKDKVYEPYTVHSYPLDSTLTLRGVPKLVDGQLVADGDWYEPDGKQTVRFGERAYQSGDESLADAITDGTTTVYKLTTPTTSTASPYSEVQICDANGTEEFVTDSPVPVGHVTEYTADLRRQVENIYGIPALPDEDGAYTLHATVASGVKTFTWESES